jgi:hypothetical protein
MNTRPIIEKVLSIHATINFGVSLDKKKGWYTGNPSYKKEPKIEIPTKKGMILLNI